MYRYYKRKIVVLLFLALCLVFGLLHNKKEPVWVALVGSIPDRLTTAYTDTTTYYILRQTHERLFRRDDGQNYESRILQNWSRNVDSSIYTFCPKTSLAFYGTTRFSLSFFKNYISNVTDRYGRAFQIESNNNCFLIKFLEPSAGYLEFLARYENAPSLKLSENVEAGLGKFFIVNFSSNSVSLQRKERVSNGYNAVLVQRFSGVADPILNDRSISDLNKLSSFEQPKWLENEELGFNNLEPRSVNLLINHKDKKTRQFIYNCIDVGEFRQAFVPKRKYFYDIKTILPIGVPGSVAGKVEQACVKTEWKQSLKIITLANQSSDNNEQLLDFSRKLYSRTGVRMEIKRCPPRDLERLLHSRNGLRNYNLILLVMDSINSDYRDYLKYFVGDTACVQGVPDSANVLYKELIKEDNPVKKEAIGRNIISKLMEESLVLPLYQNIKKIYYPKSIKNLVVGRGFVEYPEVADFRW